MPLKREILKVVTVSLIRLLSRPEYSGLENLPKQGPVIVATNHNSRIDTMLLFINPARKDITALVADKYLSYPFFRLILNMGGVIFIDRSQADFGAFRKAREVLKEGVALGIAPEGTRSEDGQLHEGKPGTAMLAASTQTPVVPVGIANTDTYFHNLVRLGRPRVQIRFGPIMHFAPLDRSQRDEQLNLYTEDIMLAIARLLPERQRGFYQNHPRL